MADDTTNYTNGGIVKPCLLIVSVVAFRQLTCLNHRLYGLKMNVNIRPDESMTELVANAFLYRFVIDSSIRCCSLNLENGVPPRIVPPGLAAYRLAWLGVVPPSLAWF